MPERVRSAALVGAAWVAAAVVLRLPALQQPLDRDESLYALIGSRLARNFLPYRDFFDHKQPFAYLPYRLFGWVAPRSTTAVRLGAAVVAGVTAALCFALMRRVAGRPAATLAAAVVLVASSADVVEGADLNTEHLLAPVAVAVVLGSLVMASKRDWRVPFLCGLGVTVAGLTKAVGVFIAVPVLVPLLVHTHARRRTLAVFAAGAAVLPAIFLMAYVAMGSVSELWRGNLVYNVRYVRSFPALPLWRWLTFPAPLQLLVGAALAVSIVRVVQNRGRDVTTWTVLLWLVAAIAGAKLGRRDIAHYLAPVVAPAAVVLCLPVVGAKRRSLAIAASLALVATVPFAYDTASRVGHTGDALALRHFGVQAHTWLVQDEAGAWLRARARPTDTAFVTGAEPAFYWLSGLKPASYYLFDYPQQLDPEHFGPRVHSDLTRSPPRFLVLTSPGAWPRYLDPLKSLPYRQRATFGPVRIFERPR